MYYSSLIAMHTNEKPTNKRYGEAAALDFPPDVKASADKNHADERRHLPSVEDAPKRVGGKLT